MYRRTCVYGVGWDNVFLLGLGPCGPLRPGRKTGLYKPLWSCTWPRGAPPEGGPPGFAKILLQTWVNYPPVRGGRRTVSLEAARDERYGRNLPAPVVRHSAIPDPFGMHKSPPGQPVRSALALFAPPRKGEGREGQRWGRARRRG